MNSKLRSMVLTAMLAAIICVLAPISLPIGPVSVTLGTFAVHLSACVLGWKRGTVSILLYLCIGAIGLPVFSNFSGGLAKLVGPTGGYLAGYIPLALIVGLCAGRLASPWLDRGLTLIGMAVGETAMYVLGTAWYCFATETPAAAALAICVYPFLLVDALKMAAVLVIAPPLRRQLDKLLSPSNKMTQP